MPFDIFLNAIHLNVYTKFSVWFTSYVSSSTMQTGVGDILRLFWGKFVIWHTTDRYTEAVSSLAALEHVDYF